MNLFGRVFKLDLVGEDVRQLHGEPTQFSMVIPDSDRQNAKFS